MPPYRAVQLISSLQQTAALLRPRTLTRYSIAAQARQTQTCVRTSCVIFVEQQVREELCQAHEAYQFLRRKHSEKYGEWVPPPEY